MLAWAGVIRPQLDLSRLGASIIATPANVPFYLALQVVQRRGNRLAVDRRAARRGSARPIVCRRRSRVVLPRDVGLNGFSVRPGERYERRHRGAALRRLELPTVRRACRAAGRRARSRSGSPKRIRARAGLAFLWRSAVS